MQLESTAPGVYMRYQYIPYLEGSQKRWTTSILLHPIPYSVDQVTRWKILRVKKAVAQLAQIAGRCSLPRSPI
jgi:hypothetical protein